MTADKPEGFAEMTITSNKSEYVKQVLPLEAAAWQILVQPREAMTKFGQIELPEEVQRVQEITTSVGRVLEIGPTAFEGRTSSGVPLNRIAAGIDKPSDLIGKFVLYAKFTGHEVKIKHPQENKVGRIIVLTVTEILCIVHRPELIIGTAGY